MASEHVNDVIHLRVFNKQVLIAILVFLKEENNCKTAYNVTM